MMEFNFEPVRIGNKRQDVFKERLLKENYKNLKEQIKDLFLSDSNFFENDIIDIVLIIPQKGLEIKIAILKENNKKTNDKLKKCLPNFIYKGGEDKVYENIFNDIWG